MKLDHVLLATDFSSPAQRAEEYACFFAARKHARLTVISVLEFAAGMDPAYPVNHQYLTERMQEASVLLTEAKQRIANRGISASTRIETGPPSEAIVAAALTEAVDFIVLGTSGRSGLAHVLLGSTAERVISRAPCPVLAVRSTGGTEMALKRILVPIDFFDCSLDAAEYAAQMANESGSAIRLLHVMEPVSYGLDFTLGDATDLARVRERRLRQLEELATALVAAGISTTSVIRGGIPRNAILEESRQWSSDLIVMGTHGRRGISHLLNGSVAEAVLRQADCPILAIRSPKFHPDHRRLIPVSVRQSLSR
ncbi:putative Universal stress protein [Nitrospira japonica]|uniref:Putative Universal stress protein n=1 Tax=Nitrospira japonica TaxID=1325564 RepID=A0A1W1I2K4_9BACT|nr:universal stress protein [Nitrospira japonica]SLM47238.1 putative Universal stress protein [Nitrospira japonica]